MGPVGAPDDGGDAERVEPAPPALGIVLSIRPPARTRARQTVPAGQWKRSFSPTNTTRSSGPSRSGECQGRKPRRKDLFSSRAARMRPSTRARSSRSAPETPRPPRARPAPAARPEAPDETPGEPAEPLGREDRVERIDRKEKADRRQIEKRPGHEEGQRRREKQEIAPRVPPGEAQEEQQRQQPVVAVAVGLEAARVEDQIVRKAEELAGRSERTGARRAPLPTPASA